MGKGGTSRRVNSEGILALSRPRFDFMAKAAFGFRQEVGFIWHAIFIDRNKEIVLRRAACLSLFIAYPYPVKRDLFLQVSYLLLQPQSGVDRLRMPLL